MKLENLLAENMLRFGVKNLSESQLKTIVQLIEQTAKTPTRLDQLSDSETVKGTPGYEDLLSRLIDLANKNKGTVAEVKSLNYWAGGLGDDKNVKYTSLLTTNMAAIAAAIAADPQKANYPDLTALNTLLADNAKNNVYVNWNTVFPRLTTQLVTIAKTIKTTPANIKLIKNPEIVKEVNNVIKNFTVQANGKDVIPKSAIATIVDADKIKLIAAAVAQAAAARKKIKGADHIVIAPKTEIDSIQRELQTLDATQGQEVATSFTWPSIDTPNPELNNFFGDNLYIVSADQKAKFATLLKTAVDSLKAQGLTLNSIGYNAGSSTSAVPTAYIGQGKVGKNYSDLNNVTLVNDRLASIDGSLLEAIKNNPDTANLPVERLTSPESGRPNQGPVWNNDARTKYPLDKRDPKSPTYDATVANEYNSIYGKHRFSFGAFTINGTKVPPTEPDKKITYSAIGNWGIKLSWNEIKITPPTMPGSIPNVSVYKSSGNGISCPKF